VGATEIEGEKGDKGKGKVVPSSLLISALDGGE
jgi:hypothetical protein